MTDGTAAGGVGSTVARRTRLVRNTCSRPGPMSAGCSMRSASMRAAARAMSPIGWRSVLSWNTSHAAMGMSSNPRIETSWGTRTPRDSAASSAPNATTSLPQTIAVGGSGRRSSSRVCW